MVTGIFLIPDKGGRMVRMQWGWAANSRRRAGVADGKTSAVPRHPFGWFSHHARKAVHLAVTIPNHGSASLASKSFG